LNNATQASQIWLKLNAYIYGSQAFAKLFEQPLYNTPHNVTIGPEYIRNQRIRIWVNMVIGSS